MKYYREYSTFKFISDMLAVSILTLYSADKLYVKGTVR